MKADYLRTIYECISGDNGLLYGYTREESFAHAFEDRNEGDISEEQVDKTYHCEIYERIFNKEGQSKVNSEEQKEINFKDFYSHERTLRAYLEHEVIFEYEKAKRCFFDERNHARKLKPEADIQESEVAEFHSVFLSSLLNQCAFIGDVRTQRWREADRERIGSVEAQKKMD